jgi:hypothetical protein
MHADALDAQMNYTREHHNSGGGRTEETRDRVNQQQIDRSRISNRTRARGTEIAAGTTSADGWTTFLAKRQVAAIEMRVGQNGGPLPSEAIFDFGEPIIYFLHLFTRTFKKGVFCNKTRVTPHEEATWKNQGRFLQQGLRNSEVLEQFSRQRQPGRGCKEFSLSGKSQTARRGTAR